MSDVYCADADVVPFLPPGGLPNAARVVTGSASGGYLESDGHGLATDSAVTLRVAVGGSLPSPLVAGTTYYAIVLSPSRFQLAVATAGTAIALTTDGLNFEFWSPLPLAAWRANGSRRLDSVISGTIGAHAVPLKQDLVRFPSSNGYDPQAVAYAAEYAAAEGLARTGGAQLSGAAFGAVLAVIDGQARIWAKGLPVRGLAMQASQPANLAITASAGAYDPRGWGGDDDTRLP